jgi:hypothetical protein
MRLENPDLKAVNRGLGRVMDVHGEKFLSVFKLTIFPASGN